MFKKIAFVLIIILATSAMGASCDCAGSGSKSDLPTVHLTIWGPIEGEEIYKPIIDDYIAYTENEMNLSIDYVKKDYAEFEESTLNALAAGTGPDIWIIKNDWVYKHADKLVSMPDGLLKRSDNDSRTNLQIYKDTFPDIAVQDNIINNEIYGMPYSIDTLVVYYNKDHFKEVHKQLYEADRDSDAQLLELPPNNWEEFLKASELLTKKDSGGNIIRSGAALGTADNVDNSTDILAALMIQNKTQMVSADRLTATYNLAISKDTGEPAYTGTQALNFYTSFADKNKENYMWNSSMPNSVDAFIQGKASMMINYSYVQKRIGQEAPTLNYKISPFPQIAGATESTDYASYWTNTVTNNSQNPDEAWNFINYVFNNDLTTYLNATELPSAKRINNLEIPKTKERVSSGENPLKFQKMTAKYWYEGKYPVKVANSFYQMIQDVVVNKQPLQKSIDASASTVTELYKLSAQSNTSPSPSPSVKAGD